MASRAHCQADNFQNRFARLCNTSNAYLTKNRRGTAPSLEEYDRRPSNAAGWWRGCVTGSHYNVAHSIRPHGPRRIHIGYVVGVDRKGRRSNQRWTFNSPACAACCLFGDDRPACGGAGVDLMAWGRQGIFPNSRTGIFRQAFRLL